MLKLYIVFLFLKLYSNELNPGDIALSKEADKNVRVIGEVLLNQSSMENSIWSTSLDNMLDRNIDDKNMEASICFKDRKVIFLDYLKLERRRYKKVNSDKTLRIVQQKRYNRTAYDYTISYVLESVFGFEKIVRFNITVVQYDHRFNWNIIKVHIENECQGFNYEGWIPRHHSSARRIVENVKNLIPFDVYKKSDIFGKKFRAKLDMNPNFEESYKYVEVFTYMEKLSERFMFEHFKKNASIEVKILEEKVDRLIFEILYCLNCQFKPSYTNIIHAFEFQFEALISVEKWNISRMFVRQLYEVGPSPILETFSDDFVKSEQKFFEDLICEGGNRKGTDYSCEESTIDNPSKNTVQSSLKKMLSPGTSIASKEHFITVQNDKKLEYWLRYHLKNGEQINIEGHANYITKFNYYTPTKYTFRCQKPQKTNI